jgi:hypothetical protein
LFIALNQDDAELWSDKLELIAQFGGMALPITHPDYLDSPRRIDAYQRLLERARQISGMWHALPRDVARWWRARDESTLARGDDGTWSIHGPASERGRAATVRVATTGAFAADDASSSQDREPENWQGFEWVDAATADRPQVETAACR